MDRNYNKIINNKYIENNYNIIDEINLLYNFAFKYPYGWKLAFKKWFNLGINEPYSILIDNLPENYKVEFDYEIDNNIYNIKLKFTQNITDKSFIKTYAVIFLCMPDITNINKVNICVNENYNYINFININLS